MRLIITSLICLVSIGACGQWTSAGGGSIYYNGKVGIGINAPRVVLDVGTYINNGVLGAVWGRLSEGDGVGEGTFLGVRGYSTQESHYLAKSFSIEHGFYGVINSSVNFHRGNGTSGGFISFCTNDNSEKMRINRFGRVGIGTTNPDALLTVNGEIHALGIRVDLDIPAPDYVFDESYKLLSISDLSKYINQHKHLPEVPSANDLQKNGLNVAEMNMLLLKKVEELTLYVIELKSEIDALKKASD